MRQMLRRKGEREREREREREIEREIREDVQGPPGCSSTAAQHSCGRSFTKEASLLCEELTHTDSYSKTPSVTRECSSGLCVSPHDSPFHL
jgi:hypothetical protein